MSIRIEAATPGGALVVLATKANEDSPVAQCAAEGCSTTLQRTVNGSLADGVRAHYRTVHPERNVR